MGSIRKLIGKKGVSWFAEVCVNNRRSSKTFNTRKDGISWINTQELKGILCKHTMHDAFDKYKPYAMELRGWQPALSRVKSLKNKIPNIPLEDFNFATYNEWRDIRIQEIGANSFNREAGVLSKILRMCVNQWGWLHSHPIPDIGRLKDKPPRKRGISKYEIDAILENLKHNRHGVEISILFLLALETAMRLGELLSIKWENTHEKYVHLKITKNGDARDVPLSLRARELIKLRKGLNESKIFSLSVQNASKNFSRCSVNGIRFHDTRSEAITRMSKKISILDLASAVGHRDLRSLQIYYKDSVLDMADKL